MKRQNVKLSLFFFIVLSAVFGAYLQWMARAADSPGQGVELDRSAGATLKLLVFGDQGSGSAHQKAVAESLEAKCRTGIDGVLLLGDNFYPHGVSSVDDPQWKTKFEEIYGGPCLLKTPFYVTLGNHDYQGSPLAVIQYSDLSPRWIAPGRFYGVKFGALLELIDFDTSIADWCFSVKDCSFSFLLSSLAKPKSTAWRLVAGHHPLRSSSLKGFTYDGNDPRAFFMRKAICGKADIALFGHSHHLEMRRDRDCETPYAVLGGGGGDVAKVSPNGKPVFLHEGFGFGQLTVTRDELNLDFYDEAGSLLHREKISPAP